MARDASGASAAALSRSYDSRWSITRAGKSMTWPWCTPSVYTSGGASAKVMIRVVPIMNGWASAVVGTICTMERVTLITLAMCSSNSAIPVGDSTRRRTTDSSRIAHNLGGVSASKSAARSRRAATNSSTLASEARGSAARVIAVAYAFVSRSPVYGSVPRRGR